VHFGQWPTEFHWTGDISTTATCTKSPVEFAESLKYGLSDGVALLGIVAPRFLLMF